MAIVGDAFHVLAFGGSDRAAASVRDAAAEFRGRGATVLLADAQGGDLPVLAAHPAIEPVLMIQSFYRMASALALARGWTCISRAFRFRRSEEHTSELQSLMRTSYSVFFLTKKKKK